MNTDSIRIGIVGCGGFARYAVGEFIKLTGVQVTAMCEPDEHAAQLGAEAFGIPNVDSPEALAQRDDVDLMYIGTPPALHHPQALAALRAGKHVICEKPLAISNEQAAELVVLAGERDRLLVANLMQRYNPIFDTVRRVIESRLLGDVLHGFLENYASDENLSIEHWFWKPEISARIFIEHGVHFFDLFEGWLGPGRVVAAQRNLRPGSNIEDQVLCTVAHDSNVHVHHYHGFTQPGRFDRQTFRLLFERGEITLEEWVPTRLTLRALTDAANLQRLAALLPGAKLTTLAEYKGDERQAGGRHKSFVVDQMVEFRLGDEVRKMDRYAEILQGMFADQWAWIRDHSHVRRITEENGRRSVAMAVDATRLASE